MLGATISVYINQQFTWTLSKDPFGAHARLCLRVTPLQTSPLSTLCPCFVPQGWVCFLLGLHVVMVTPFCLRTASNHKPKGGEYGMVCNAIC